MSVELPEGSPFDLVLTSSEEPEPAAGVVSGLDQFAVHRGQAWHRAAATRLQSGLASTDQMLAQRGTELLVIPGDRLEEAADDDLFHVQRGSSPFQVSGARVKNWLQQFASPRTLGISAWAGGFVFGTPMQMRAGETGTARHEAQDVAGVLLPDMPWLLTESEHSPLSRTRLQQVLPAAGGAYGRLYAMGLDAYRLLPHLGRLQSSPLESLDGHTGNLYVTADNHVHRQLVWVRLNVEPEILGYSPRLDLEQAPATPEAALPGS